MGLECVRMLDYVYTGLKPYVCNLDDVYTS